MDRLAGCRGLCWLGVVVALLGGSVSAQPRPSGETADEVRAALRAWDWEGDWFQDCGHKDRGGHYVAVLGESGFPTGTMFYDGKQMGEGRLIAASVQSDGTLVAIAENLFENMVSVRSTLVEVNRDGAFQLLSVELDFEAISDVPPNSFALKPGGMERGARFHAWGVRDAMVLDRFEKPLRATAVYRRCDERSS